MRVVEGLATRRWTLILGVMLAVAIGGCGDSDDSGSNGGDAKAASSDSTTSGEGAEVAAAMRQMREIYNDQNGEEFCARLTADGREEVIGAGRDYELKPRTCPGIVNDISGRVVRAGSPQRPVDVRRVSVNGDKARVVITGGLAGVRRVVPFRFVKSGDEWLLDDPISGSTRVIKTDLSIPLNP